MWTAIAVTCSNGLLAEIIQKELQLLQKRKLIHENTILLAIEDPVRKIGSGSATLNALLVTAEFLSAKADYQVVTADVLHSSSILILHCGRDYPYDPCGKAFVVLPKESSDESSVLAVAPIFNLQQNLNFVSLLAKSSPPGVWVCSTDMFLDGIPTYHFTKSHDIVLFATSVPISFATNHGAVKIDPEGYIANILFSGKEEDIRELSTEGNVPVVAGIVYFSVTVAESLLSLHVCSPLDSCTYMGFDSGANPLQVSLYFDILISMAVEVTKEAFLSGEHGKTYNKNFGFNEDCIILRKNARSLIWKELHRFKMQAAIIENAVYAYWSELQPVNFHMKNLKNVKQNGLIHSYLKHSQMADKDLIINSYLENVTSKGFFHGTIFQNCSLSGSETKPITIGDNCYLNGIKLQNSHLELDDNLAFINFKVLLPNHNETDDIPVIIGIQDNLKTNFKMDGSTLYNKPWQEFFDVTKITPQDLWTQDSTDVHCLMTAKLFPINKNRCDCIQPFFLTKKKEVTKSEIQEWLQSPRLSFQEILTFASNTNKNFDWRKEVFLNVLNLKITDILTYSKDQSLLPYFWCATLEGWESSVLSTLDNVSTTFDCEPGKAARTLASIADMLGCMASKAGGLRTGPAANKTWRTALSTLEMGGPNSIVNGVKALKSERTHWLGHPSRLIRAARHYEGASQVLIRQAVMTAQQHIALSACQMPDLGKWIEALCPARVDFQGGWSDTPPICYELGGCVTNVALLIKGKKPIGAKARRINEPSIILHLCSEEISTKIVIRTLEDLSDYSQPMLPGSLLKAAIVCTEIVDLKSNRSLEVQLMEKYGSGIEIHSWSNLPQGSGLGTSSILAGAIITVLWLVTGRLCNRKEIIHAVLNLEQILTTGGGWQDQIGGVYGGVNCGYSSPSLPLLVEVETVNLPTGFCDVLNRHLVLIYTGKVRLAKNLLQNVIRNWYARNSDIVKCFKELTVYAKKCADAFTKGDLAAIGYCMNKYWEMKKYIAPGCNPSFIENMMKNLEPHVYGQTLAGAGGGGFICLITKEANSYRQIQEIINKSQDTKYATIYPASLDMTGITVFIDDQQIFIS